MELCKHSLPGWRKEVGSELEAKEILFGYICDSCRRDLKKAQLGNRSYSFFDESIRHPTCRPIQLHECSLEDLLRVGCGLEFSFTEEKE